MYVQIKVLSEPKTGLEPQMNEDAFAVAPQRGVFVVADGAGTRYCSGEWAQALARHFLDVPLNSDNVFETHWWLQQAQQSYHPSPPTRIDWKVQQKAKEGGACTLCGIRMTSVKATKAKAQAFAIGDSCLLMNNWFGGIDAFPLQEAAAFQRAPRCLPSLPQHYRRSFHRLESHTLHVVPGTTVLLATDAVARWVLSHPAGQWDAFWGVVGMNEATWPAFLAGCRASGKMEDDDATALILSFTKEPVGSKLGATPPHASSLREERQRLLEEAIKVRDHERIALLYGDGQDCRAVRLAQEEVQAARRLSEILDELRAIFQRTVSAPAAAMQVAQVLEKHPDLLVQEQYQSSVMKVLSPLQAQGLLAQVSFPSLPLLAQPSPTLWSRLRTWLHEEGGPQ